jgi:hypothetical protein
MTNITISDEFYRLLERKAQATNSTPEDVLEFILWQEFTSGQSRQASELGLTKPTSPYALEYELYQRNIATFSRLLPELLREHQGEYVAIRDEQVVGFGHDATALWQTTREKYESSGGLLVTKVSTTANHMLTSPHFRRH